MLHRILELYSGIGGMHCAWCESGLPGEIIAAVDINTVANEVYKHNFPETTLLNKNIQGLTSTEIEKLDVNTILMSPPCQPFTRNGKYLDKSDPRTDSFIALLDIMKELNHIEYILMENVKGFECSSVRNIFIETLQDCGFEYQEFLLSPTTVGIPNSRLRYYCIARKTGLTWKHKNRDNIGTTLHKDYGPPHALAEIIEPVVSETFLIPDKLLKRANILDICYKESTRSCCFTKAYSHYIEGTGSVFTNATPVDVDVSFKIANSFTVGSEDFIRNLKPLKLRFFTPTEVLQLMAFPHHFSLPDNITLKQCYRLLGNSVNVKVISELLKILYS